MSAGHKRQFGATIRTLSDITNSASDDEASRNKPSAAATATSGFHSTSSNTTNGPSNHNGPPADKIKIQHIPTLPRSNDASSTLARIHSEFSQIISKRKYNVKSITEMCCCSDGLDHLPNRRGRKTKIMPNNVLGYNLTQFTNPKTHAIHLRLRHPATHELVDYESIAGTMCHELAHCEVGPHNAQFYKVMEEIEEQYAIFLARGVVVDKQGFPVGSDDAYKLGGRKVSPEEARRRAMMAAEKRRGLSCGQYVLGGKSKVRDPKEAARIAAERRLRDSQFCLPCNEIIELLGDDLEDEDAVHAGEKKRKAKPTLKCVSDQVIDLTEDEPIESHLNQTISSTSQVSNKNQWECPCCTLINQPLSMLCEVCDAPPGAPAVVYPPVETSQHAAARNINSETKSDGALHDGIIWSCPRCTFENTSMSLICGACCLER